MLLRIPHALHTRMYRPKTETVFSRKAHFSLGMSSNTWCSRKIQFYSTHYRFEGIVSCLKDDLGFKISCKGEIAPGWYNMDMGLPTWLCGKESAYQCRRCRRHGLIPGSGRCPGEGNGNPLQYSRLGNHIDREAWQATVHGVAKTEETESSRHSLDYSSLGSTVLGIFQAKILDWGAISYSTSLH